MFAEVWQWAGTYRLSEKQIGVDPLQIAVRVEEMVRNVRAQIDGAAYALDEIAARYHHAMVKIHPFPNGNGRHARLATDLLVERVMRRPPFSWGNVDLVHAGAGRNQYVAALRTADAGNIQPLLTFVRS